MGYAGVLGGRVCCTMASLGRAVMRLLDLFGVWVSYLGVGVVNVGTGCCSSC